MSVISLTLSNPQILELKEKYSSYSVKDNNPYILYRFHPADCVITVYTSKKAVFQGNKAEEYAKDYQRKETFPSAGSDEVGTGDYYGPICVCAALITEENYKKIEKYHITDSKKTSDEKIREIAPVLIKELKHYCYILDNSKYNEISPANNMNRIKARMHNYAYLKLRELNGSLPKLAVVDQFTPEDKYYQYLFEDKKIVRNLHFETKAESKYSPVAAASLIARYKFLIQMDELSEKYHLEFPKGAGEKVDIFTKEFVKKYGKDELKKVAKLNFKNTEKIQ